MFKKFFSFITTDIWRINLRDLNKAPAVLLKQLRVVFLALRSFHEDRCYLRASALTFYSLIAIVPIFAMTLGVAKGFGIEERFREELFDKLYEHQEVASFVIDYAHRLLNHINQGFIAGVGVLILFWTVMKLLSNIEHSFNDIWGVKKSRGFVRKVSDYLSIMVIGPIFLIATSGFTVFLASEMQFVIERFPFLSTLNPLFYFVLHLVPYLLLWMIFTFIYIVLPNTKVRSISGIVAGIVAGTIYQMVQWIYIKFLVGVASYDAVYGSFAALPLFLIWLQISWLVVLLGAEVAFALENVESYEFESECSQASLFFKKLVTLRVVNLIIQNFVGCKAPLSATEISQQLGIPIKLIRQALEELCQAEILREVVIKNRNTAYIPSQPPAEMTLFSVISSLEHHGNEDIPHTVTAEWNDIKKALQSLEDRCQKAPENRCLKSL
ncbi:MAG: YihY/virulence factor BrkB family protein [Chlamydiota bacterium]